jgi:hypothetical protein
MRNIVDREDQDLGKSVGLRFVGVAWKRDCQMRLRSPKH